MKIIQVILFFLAFNVLLASAEIKILFPSAQYYLVEGANEILWEYTSAQDPIKFPTFSIYLNNEHRPEIKLLAMSNHVQTNLNKTIISMQNVADTGFQLLFKDETLNTTLATSESFEVKPAGTTPAVYVTPTPTPIPTPTPTASGAANSAGASTTSKSSSNSIHSDGFGTLVLITLFTVILF